MEIVEPDPHELHSLEVVTRMTGTSRKKIVFYCRKGVLNAAEQEGEWRFDEECVIRLKYIEALRQQHRMNWVAIRTIMKLMDEVELLREELRFRR